MDFFVGQGVDNTFADELVELSTALEQQEYITFLEDLKSFLKSQESRQTLKAVALWQALASERILL